jgi:hypothetical protein
MPDLFDVALQFRVHRSQMLDHVVGQLLQKSGFLLEDVLRKHERTSQYPSQFLAKVTQSTERFFDFFIFTFVRGSLRRPDKSRPSWRDPTGFCTTRPDCSSRSPRTFLGTEELCCNSVRYSVQIVFAGLSPTDLVNRPQQIREVVGVVIADFALKHRRQPLEAHTRVHVFFRQQIDGFVIFAATSKN